MYIEQSKLKEVVDLAIQKGLSSSETKQILIERGYDFNNKEFDELFKIEPTVIDIESLFNDSAKETKYTKEEDLKLNKKRMIKGERITIAILILWTFIHSFILIMSLQMNYHKERYYGMAVSSFWKENTLRDFIPITYHTYFWDVSYYDYTEFLIYVVFVWLLFFLYKFINKGE